MYTSILSHIDEDYVLRAIDEIKNFGTNEEIEKLIRFVQSDFLATVTHPSFRAINVDLQLTYILTASVRLSQFSDDTKSLASALAYYFGKVVDDQSFTIDHLIHYYDILYGWFWRDAANTSEMACFFNDCVSPFHSRLAREIEPADCVRNLPDHLSDYRVGILVNYGHDTMDNGVLPHIDAILLYLKKVGIEVFVYCTYNYDQAYFNRVQALGHTIRTIEFKEEARINRNYDGFASEIKADRLDVLLGDTARGNLGLYFQYRLAPVQVFIDYGMPYWMHQQVDLVCTPGKKWRGDYPFPKKITLESKPSQTLTEFRGRHVEENLNAVADVRKRFPEDAFIIGCFTRLSKVTIEMMSCIETVLLSYPQAYFILAGTGKADRINKFFERSAISDKVLFLQHNVDLNVYGAAIDLFADTFPFVGGNACREVMDKGTPIVSMQSMDWDFLSTDGRDPALVAEDQEHYVALLMRCIEDEAFLQDCQKATRSIVEKDVQETVFPSLLMADIQKRFANRI